MKRVVIVNPAAGKGLSEYQLNLLKKVMDESNEPYRMYQSNGPNDIGTLCSNLDSTVEEVIIAGGDGSVQEVMESLMHRTISISVIPSGTGNDLYRSLYDNESKRSIEEIICGFSSFAYKKINICTINEKIFVNVASMGLDAQIVENSLKLRRLIRSSKTYLISALFTILFYKPRCYTIITDEGKMTIEAFLIAVGNGRYYGGGMAITPKADIESDVLDICVVKKMNRFKLLKLLPTVYNGKHLQFDEVLYWKSKNIEIVPQSKELINLDGELGLNDRFIVKDHLSKLSVR